jgi:hypothetical protein
VSSHLDYNKHLNLVDKFCRGGKKCSDYRAVSAVLNESIVVTDRGEKVGICLNP